MPDVVASSKALIQYQGEYLFLQEMLRKTNACHIGEQAIRFDGDNWTHIVGLLVS